MVLSQDLVIQDKLDIKLDIIVLQWQESCSRFKNDVIVYRVSNILQPICISPQIANKVGHNVTKVGDIWIPKTGNKNRNYINWSKLVDLGLLVNLDSMKPIRACQLSLRASHAFHIITTALNIKNILASQLDAFCHRPYCTVTLNSN